MIYGYVRVSTRKQSKERQVRNILAVYPDAVIVEEVYTRRSLDRRKWNWMMGEVVSGDTIVFDSVSRMSGDADEGTAAYMDLFGRGINLVFLNEHHIDTDTYKGALNNLVSLTGTDVDFILDGVNKYLRKLADKQIRLAFEQSEKEVTDLSNRTKGGMETARRHGKQIGQVQGKKLNVKKAVEAKKVILKHSKDFNGTLNDKDVMKLAGIANNTYYKYKAELREEIEVS